jgi:hypothetical protein
MSDDAPTTDREAILARYRRLRELSREHHDKALRFLARDALLDHARGLGIAQGKAIAARSSMEVALAMDLALYSAKPGRSRALDRYAKAAGLPEGSDEAVMLEAMRRSRFSLWRLERKHETAGVVIKDAMREAEAWLVDERIEEVAPEGMVFAARVCRPEPFEMICGIAVPVDQAMGEAVFGRALPGLRGAPAQIADDPRFASAVYRAAVERGLFAGAQRAG